MFRSKFPIAMAIAAMVALQPFLLTSISAQEAIPDTPAGNCLAKLIEAVNSTDEDRLPDFLKNGFDDTSEEAVKERAMHSEQVKMQLGKINFQKALSSSDHQITALCTTSNGPEIVMTLNTTDAVPYKIDAIQLEMRDSDEEPDVSPLDTATRTEVIKTLASELRSKYVFPKVGEEMALAIEKSDADGDYDEIDDVHAMAKQLSDQLRDICHDKHLRVRAGAPRSSGSRPGRRSADNHGFVKAEILPGGIGYLKFNYFSGDVQAQKTASAAMNFLSNSKALIFDLRDNGGGSPEMIAFLTSYLYEEPVHLNSFYNRPTDTTTESWTQKDVPGKRIGKEVPIFVLTSSHTFSGAEEFSYNLKNLKRGTIVGETTGGGAHPVMPVTLGKRFFITMPFARAINPITKTNWEGVGVKPDVEVDAADALAKAVKLASSLTPQIASVDPKPMEKTETSSTADKAPKKKPASSNANAVFEKAQDLMADESFAEAATAFAVAAKLNPENEAAWFNLGYCLHASGELDKAMVIHKKAAEFERYAGIATYNIACVHSLQDHPDSAFEALNQAIELGFGDSRQIKGDSDFDNIREDPRFDLLLKRLRDNQ